MEFADRWEEYRKISREPGIQEKFSRWTRIKNFFAEHFGPIAKKTLKEDAMEILTGHWDMIPDEVIAALEKKGHSKEDITEFFGPLGEFWKKRGVK